MPTSNQETEEWKYSKLEYKQIYDSLVSAAHGKHPALRNEILVRLLLGAGLKATEICALSWEDVGEIKNLRRTKITYFSNFDEIIVNSGACNNWDCGQIYSLRSDADPKRMVDNQKRRTVRISDAIQEAVSYHFNRLRNETGLSQEDLMNQPLMCSYDFMLDDSEIYPLKPKSVSDLFKALASDAGYKGFTPSDARRFAILRRLDKKGLLKGSKIDEEKISEISKYFGFSDNRIIKKIRSQHLSEEK